MKTFRFLLASRFEAIRFCYFPCHVNDHSLSKLRLRPRHPSSAFLVGRCSITNELSDFIFCQCSSISRVPLLPRFRCFASPRPSCPPVPFLNRTFGMSLPSLPPNFHERISSAAMFVVSSVSSLSVAPPLSPLDALRFRVQSRGSLFSRLYVQRIGGGRDSSQPRSSQRE